MKSKNRQSSGEERRKWPRLKPSAIPFLKSIALGQGTEVDAIDISQGGMLVQTEVRLRPQMKIHLKLVTSEGIVRIEGSVLRSSIASLNGGPRYQSAIVFEHPFDMLNGLSNQLEEPPIEAQPEPTAEEKPDENTDQPFPPPAFGEFDESSSILTIIAQDISGLSGREKFKFNDW